MRRAGADYEWVARAQHKHSVLHLDEVIAKLLSTGVVTRRQVGHAMRSIKRYLPPEEAAENHVRLAERMKLCTTFWATMRRMKKAEQAERRKEKPDA
jgi:hypothetical protein